MARRLLDVCERWPRRVALVDVDADKSDQRVDYVTLKDESDRIAGLLRSHGVQRDEPILLFVSNRPHDLLYLLGIWRVGAIGVPVHRSSVPATVEHVLEATGARYALGWDDFTQTSLPSNAWRSGDLVMLGVKPPPYREELCGGLLVVFTSGSTGLPKGVVLSDAGFDGKLDAIDQVLAFQDGARSLLVLQINFSFAQWVSLLTMSHGGTLFLLRKFAPGPFLSALSRFDIDYTAVVPTMLRATSLLIEEKGEASVAPLRHLSCPRLIIAGGEPLSAELGRRFRELLPATGLTDVYGLTETCTSDFILPPDLYDEYPGSIGFPSPHVCFRISDPETGDVVTPGTEGELEVASPFVMTGYLGASDLARNSRRAGYFRTGDLARLDADGAVRLAGRIKDVIVRAGNKVSPLEIDQALAGHPLVRSCLTTGVEDSLLGQRIHTLIVPEAELPRESELRTWLSDKLDRYKIPDRFYRAAAIPQGKTGKADRRSLRERVLLGTLETLS